MGWLQQGHMVLEKPEPIRVTAKSLIHVIAEILQQQTVSYKRGQSLI